MTSLRLYKKEKLCGFTAVERLFTPGGRDGAAMAYPWRAVWKWRGESDANAGDGCARFVITVPKRRLRHAVDRVRMRRVMREAYRLNRHLLPERHDVDIAFIYVASQLTSYADAERSLAKIFSRLNDPRQ